MKHEKLWSCTRISTFWNISPSDCRDSPPSNL